MSEFETINPDELPELSHIPEGLRSLVFSPGGPLQQVSHERLLTKLIATDVVFADRDTLDLDLAHAADTVALVHNDPTATNNGWFRKLGASGDGSWEQFEELAKSVRVAAEAARDAAEASALEVASVLEGGLEGQVERITTELPLRQGIDGFETVPMVKDGKLVQMSIYDFAQYIQSTPSPPALTLLPGDNFDGTRGSGFAVAPVNPDRTKARAICQLVDVERQTLTQETLISVVAFANDNGTLANNLGISRVDFMFEGRTLTVNAPSLRVFTRFDGSNYILPVWSVRLGMDAIEGIADLYVEAVPNDATMQSQVIGPHPFLLRDEANRYDHRATVAASGTMESGEAADFTTIEGALQSFKDAGADHPLIEVGETAVYEPGSIVNNYIGEGYCTIRGLVPYTIKQAPPALDGDFTRIQFGYDRLLFQGANTIIDMVETNVIDTASADPTYWFDRCRIMQSAGRESLKRLAPRNILPSLVDSGAYFTDCFITDVHDPLDKAPLGRGNIISETWGDIAQAADCTLGNVVIDHTSEFHYTNVDALSVEYTGGAGQGDVAFPGGNDANKTMRLLVDDVEVAAFDVFNGEDDFRDNTNYTVQNVADWINTVPDWTAIVLDNTRRATSLTSPGSTDGKGFDKLSATGAPLVLPTHFDIHSDGFQQINNIGAPRENVVFAFNLMWLCAMQNGLIGGTDGTRDSAFVGNAIHNKLGTADEGLQTQFGREQSHVLWAGNSTPNQATTIREDMGYLPDALCLIAGNVMRRISDAQNLILETLVVVKDNHILEGESELQGAIGTTIGGTAATLFADAANGNFAPRGELLNHQTAPIMGFDLGGGRFAALDVKGAIAMATDFDVPSLPDESEQAQTPAPPPPPPPPPPAGPPPAFVDSVQGGGTNGSVSVNGLEATGANRQIVAMVGAGTSDSVDDIACSITGTGGTVAMTRAFLTGTQHADPSLSLDAFAGFIIAEDDLPGDGPYDLQATATGANVPDKIGIGAASVENAPGAATVAFERGASISADVQSDDTLAIALLGSSTASSGASMTGAAQVENLFSYGDGIQLGWVIADEGNLTVANAVGGRTVSALALFEQG